MNCLNQLFIRLMGVSLLQIAVVGHAHVIGTYGAIYPIAEMDMMSGIRLKLESLQQSGEMARENKKIIKRTVAHIIRPNPVESVSDLIPGEVATSRVFNPSITVNHDIKDQFGHVIAIKGQTINPLNVVSMHEILVFINADNRDQITWLNKDMASLKTTYNKVKIILVRGDIKSAHQALHSLIYFDQSGVLCKHYKIKHTPTLIYQPEDKRGKLKYLMIREVSVA